MLAMSERLSENAKDSAVPMLWFGQSSKAGDEFANNNAKSGPFELHSVYIPSSIDKLYYGGFCNDTIWPLFHYFPFISVFDKDTYAAYVEANKIFAEAIIKHLQPGDFLWVHDYQLFLLPELVRQATTGVKIGFFLHIPFPSTEIYRIIPRPWREAILRGMLGADLLGFHTFDYTYHFMRCVSRILGIETSENWLYPEGRTVRADTFPISIDYKKFSDAASSKAVKKRVAEMRHSLGDLRIIFSLDRLDYTKGFLQRIAAYGHFLETYPEHRGKVVFHMIMVPSRDTMDRYRNMKKEIDSAVGSLNGRFGTISWTPILYQYRSVSFEELVACYRQSDVALITPIRDGMNLVCKEYVACQSEEKPGVLILSELAGAAAELSEALLINPMDQEEIAVSLHAAIVMPALDKLNRMRRMQERIRNYNVVSWGKDFFRSIAEVNVEQEKRDVNELKDPSKYPFIEKYVNASRKIIFLDYDGTLVPLERFPDLATPGAALKESLARLASISCNEIVVISGRSREFIDKWLGELPLHLVAEHGGCIRKTGEAWVSEEIPDNGWKAEVLSIMDRYVERCTGSFIEEKQSSLAWHYRNVQKEFGLARSHELKDEIRSWVLKNNSFQMLEGHKVIEVKRSGYDKGTAALRFLADKNHDFVLAIGDDRTDEDLFRAMPQDAVTIKVGLTSSIARYNLRNQKQVIRLLDELGLKGC
jgi:trehalose 6-phosphate synthase/phosphatase